MRWLLSVFLLGFATFVHTQPDFNKSFAPATIGPGSVSTLQFDITDNSGTAVGDVAFTDVLPAGMTIATPASTTSDCEGTLSAPDGGGTISLSGGKVAANGSCSITVNVTSSTLGTNTNLSGDLISDAGNSGSATADLTVVTTLPGFTKSFSPGSISFGGRSTLTFTIDNSANPALRASLFFTDNLPDGMVVASPANASHSCATGAFTGSVLTATPGTSVISLNLGTSLAISAVAANSSCTVTVDVVANAIGQLGNTTGELISGDPAESSGMAGAVLDVTVNAISLIKSFTDDPVPPGGTTNLEFTIMNLDRDNSATNIAFTDDLSAALSGLAATSLPLNDVCGSGSQLSGTGVLTLSSGNLPAGGSCTFSAAVDVPSAAVPGTYTNTTGSITADVDGSGVSGNPASDDLFVVAFPILTKEFTDDPVLPGNTVTLEFNITNTSPTSAATDITFSDDLPTVLQTADLVPAIGFCGAAATATFTPLFNPSPPEDIVPARLTITGASLAAGGSCTFSVIFDVFPDAANGAYTNTTNAITATVDGSTVEGLPASDDLIVVAPPQLSKAFIGDPVIAGGTVTLEFQLTHSENAPGDATNIAFTDDLDAALSGLVSTSGTLNDVCGAGSQLTGTSNLSFTGATLSPGESCNFSVTLDVPAGAVSGDYTNTTSDLTADVNGTSLTGNPASDDLTVTALTFTKLFTDDPVLPGGTVTLEFSLNLDASATIGATGMFFTDNLGGFGGALSGLVSTSGTLTDICGTGSQITGTSFLSFTGGNLAPGTGCTFSVTLDVPASATANTYNNTTSSLFATIDGSPVTLDPAIDNLVVDDPAPSIALSKSFTDDPVDSGDNVILEFTIDYAGQSNATNINFTDNLNATLSGLVATGLPVNDVCGAGSQLTGTGLLTLTGGTLSPGGSCTFSVTLQVPNGAAENIYINTTSDIEATVDAATVTGDPATDDLQITRSPDQSIKPYVLLADGEIVLDHYESVEGDIHSNGNIEYENGSPGLHDGTATAAGDIEIDSDNHIIGDVLAAGDVEVDEDATVDGTASGGQAIAPVALPALAFTCDGTNGNVFVDEDDTEDVAPGDYGVIRANDDARLNFSAGEYSAGTFKLDPEAELHVDVSGGSVTINVCITLKLRKNSKIIITGGTSHDLTINYLGVEQVELGKDGSFQGSIVAPNAKVKLNSEAGFLGSICAREIEIRKDARVRHHDFGGGVPGVAIAGEEQNTGNGSAANHVLKQNYPNPANPSTRIIYNLAQAATVKLQIYDLTGKRVRILVNDSMPAGQHETTWNGRNTTNEVVAAGMYIYRLTIQNDDGATPVVLTKKMMFLK